MSRVTWFVAGAATGVYGVYRARRAARSLTPDDLAARAAALTAGLRVFAGEVSTGMAEREHELRHPPPRAIAGPTPRHRRLDDREELLADGHR